MRSIVFASLAFLLLSGCGLRPKGVLPPMPEPLGRAFALPGVGVAGSAAKALAEHRSALVQANQRLAATRTWYEQVLLD